MNRLTFIVETEEGRDEELIPSHRDALDWFLHNINRVDETGEKKLDFDKILVKWKVERGI